MRSTHTLPAQSYVDGSKGKFAGVYVCDRIAEEKRRRISLHIPDRRTAVLNAQVLRKELSPHPETERIAPHHFLDLFSQTDKTREKSLFTFDNEPSIIIVFKSRVKNQPLEKIYTRKADHFFADLASRTKTIENQQPIPAGR